MSDWSSDVCSSDLREARRIGLVEAASIDDGAFGAGQRPGQAAVGGQAVEQRHRPGGQREGIAAGFARTGDAAADAVRIQASQQRAARQRRALEIERERSEEHTSELQSLMHISYA